MIDASKFLDSWNDLQASIRNAASQALRETVKAAETSARTTTRFKDKTGGTRQSIKGATFMMNGSVTAGGAARFLENGTSPHIISAKRGRMLAFQINGSWVHRKRVRHPGTRPRPFMADAQEVGRKALEYGLDYFISFAIRKFNG